MSDRVILFIDYQNVYRRARDCFHPLHAPHWDGQIDPLALGRLLVDHSPYDRSLAQVRVYRGQPDASRDPKGYAANQRQCATWQKRGVEVVARTLRYPPGWPTQSRPGERPQEKGIDVALAIDFVMLGLRLQYDVGILMSTDTDLKPALEAVAQLTASGGPRAEVAAWSGQGQHARRLSISSARLWCHWLDENAYSSLADPTNYS